MNLPSIHFFELDQQIFQLFRHLGGSKPSKKIYHPAILIFLFFEVKGIVLVLRIDINFHVAHFIHILYD